MCQCMSFFPNLQKSYFLQNFDGVVALDIRQNFVSAQYLENQLTEFYQILYAHQHLQDLAWDCYSPALEK